MSKLNYISALFLLLVLFFSCKGNTEQQDTEHKYTNALINETSPYLLQHAHNPVDWRVWSDEALETARDQKKLVLISIGYSSCHWCHVMERETFEDEEVAQLMNKDYINIKVDREERPDIDHIYQNALQLIKGNGGWPLNAIVLPSGKPVYLGTYHTKEQWSKVLSSFTEDYKNNPENMELYADNLAKGIQNTSVIPPATDLKGITQSSLKEGVNTWKQSWDLEWGGDIEVEKFIIPYKLEFLLDYAILTEDEEARIHVKTTLDKIASGGIYDHVGGGFFRYSTDKYWKIPHFEKMLYDNAQLLSLYSKAYSVFKEPSYKKMVKETFSFLEREMKSPEGGYYAAIDSETDGEEGKFYLWSEEELKTLLKQDFPLFSAYYHLEQTEIQEDNGIVLHNPSNEDIFARENSISLQELESYKTNWRTLLFDYRSKRVHPTVDDKILTSWNALLINGLLEAYKSFGEKEFLERAETIFDFIEDNSLTGTELVHSFKKGGQNPEGFLDDYVLMVDAALNLYGVTLKDEYLDFAQEMNHNTLTHFEDKESDFYKYTKNDKLFSKIVKTLDGFWPSPNSVMAHNLFTLGHLEYNKEHLKKSSTMLSSIVPSMKQYTQNYSSWGLLLLHNTYPYYEIAVVGKNALPLVEELNETYIPNTLLVGSLKESDLPLFEGRYADDGTYIYVCQNSTCKLPVDTVEKAIDQLEGFQSKAQIPIPFPF